MELKKVMLSLPEGIFKKLEQEQKSFCYPSVQSIILEALRERYFKKEKKGAGGRPRKLNLYNVASAKKVFE